VIDEQVRDRAANGGFAWTLDRGRDYARGIWVVDQVFMIGLVNEEMPEESVGSRDESYFGAAGVSDHDLEAAEEEDRKARLKAKRDRHAAAAPTSLSASTSTRSCWSRPTRRCERAASF